VVGLIFELFFESRNLLSDFSGIKLGLCLREWGRDQGVELKVAET